MWKLSVFFGIVFAVLGLVQFPSDAGLTLLIGAGLWFKIAGIERNMKK